jgi:hypothetical protein
MPNNFEIKNFPREDDDILIKENQLIQLHDLINAKEQMLLDKKTKLRSAMEQNMFLNEIKADYEKYYHFIAAQKEEQIRALYRLNEYIQELNKLNKKNSISLVDAKKDQQQVLREVYRIKKELSDIITK